MSCYEICLCLIGDLGSSKWDIEVFWWIQSQNAN